MSPGIQQKVNVVLKSGSGRIQVGSVHQNRGHRAVLCRYVCLQSRRTGGGLTSIWYSIPTFSLRQGLLKRVCKYLATVLRHFRFWFSPLGLCLLPSWTSQVNTLTYVRLQQKTNARLYQRRQLRIRAQNEVTSCALQFINNITKEAEHYLPMTPVPGSISGNGEDIFVV